MNLSDFLKEVTEYLKKEGVHFALAGGLAASIYRKEPRLTKDIDFLIFSGNVSQEKAQQIIKKFGLNANLIRKADLEGGPLHAIKRGRTEPLIVVGRNTDDAQAIGLDFILPAMPWFKSALARAENNTVDFGCCLVPTLTVEDVVISKFFALKNASTRFNDLDDLKCIFEAGHDFDFAYLTGQMQVLKLSVPPLLKGLVPACLGVVSKTMAKLG